MFGRRKGINVTIKTHNDKKGGHPHIIMDEVDKNYVSVGLTSSSKKGKNSPNYKLEQDPLGTNKTSYIKRQATVDNKKRYHSPRNGEMTSKDFEKAKEYANKGKEKHLDKKKKRNAKHSKSISHTSKKLSLLTKVYH